MGDGPHLEDAATFPDAGAHGRKGRRRYRPGARRTAHHHARRHALQLDTARIGRGRSTPSRREARPQTEVARLVYHPHVHCLVNGCIELILAHNRLRIGERETPVRAWRERPDVVCRNAAVRPDHRTPGMKGVPMAASNLACNAVACGSVHRRGAVRRNRLLVPCCAARLVSAPSKSKCTESQANSSVEP
jgi:hypothetical protein